MPEIQAAETQPANDIRYLCRHIFTDGHRCASPALRQQDFCYYHHTTRQPVAGTEARTRKLRRNGFILPRLDDRAAVQLAIGEVLQRIATNRIDPKRAGLLLYGLQAASANLPRLCPDEKPPAPVEEVVDEPHLGLVAPTRECEPAPMELRAILNQEHREESDRYQARIDELELEVKALRQQHFRVFMELRTRAAQDPIFQPVYEAVCQSNKAAEPDEDNRRPGFTIQAAAEAAPPTPKSPTLTPIRTRLCAKNRGRGEGPRMMTPTDLGAPCLAV